MRVHLAYGRYGLDLDLPGQVTVLERRPVPGLADEAASIREALRRPLASAPLAESVRPGDRVAIVFSDITRPMPNDRVLPVLLAELAHVPEANITLINALGSHRTNTPDELRRMLGSAIMSRYRVIQHDAWDASGLTSVGTSERGYPLLVNRHFLDADVRILTGFVEPHFFAGYSGGPKAVLPGLAGIETILHNHDFAMVAHPGATWLSCDSPMHREMERAAQLSGPSFLLNVTLNSRGEISGVYAGDVITAHTEACARVRRDCLLPVSTPFDVVVTSNGGYPLDLNLYQAVKGMSAAARIVRPGGAIVVVAECWDGLPNHGRYAALLAAAKDPAALLSRLASLAEPVQDQWQAQVQAQIQQKADVYVYSGGLSEEQIRRALLQPCLDVEATVTQLVHEKGPRVAVLPEGPFSVPTLM